jgi:hypothetical protein
MYPKQIRRNASRQLAAIFPNIHSAKSINFCDDVETRIIPASEFGAIKRAYEMCSRSKLSQISEHEFELNFGRGSSYVFSTKEVEAIAPATTEEVEQAIAPVEEATLVQEQAISNEAKDNQATGLDVELLETDLLLQTKLIEEYCNEVKDLKAKLEQVQAELNSQIDQARENAGKAATEAAKLRLEIAVAKKQQANLVTPKFSQAKENQSDRKVKNDYLEIQKAIGQKATLLLINTFGMPVVRHLTIKNIEIVSKTPTSFYSDKQLQLTYVFKGKRKAFKTRYVGDTALYLGWHEVKTPSTVVCFESGLIDKLKSQINAAPFYEQVDC